MDKVINFPINLNYRVYGIHRDGRIIVKIINSPKRFMMYAESILADKDLVRQFPKNEVKWLCDINAMDSDEYSYGI